MRNRRTELESGIWKEQMVGDHGCGVEGLRNAQMWVLSDDDTHDRLLRSNLFTARITQSSGGCVIC